jgi:peptide/nickel transport system substrate-binding protein
MRILPLLFALAVAAPACAQEARIGVQTETSAIDPHFALIGANQVVAEMIFEPLLGADAGLHPIGGVASSFARVADDVWEFRIRPGAKFHDGGKVTAEDVRFSLLRMPNVPGSPAPFVRLAGVTQAIEVAGDDVVRLRTRGFDPSVPLHAMSAWIVSARAAKDATTADFNAGRAAIGSGPWRFVAWKPGESLVLERFDPAQDFARVTMRPMGNDAARLTALLSGAVDLIDSVPPPDVERLRGDPKVKLWTAPSARFIYLALDQEHDSSPQITAADGKPLAANPLKDKRVRRALSLAINRPLIVERLLHGAGRATGQLVPEGFAGYDPAIALPKYDPAAAKALLADAGYPGGFKLVLTSPNNRYVEDDKTAQAVAQMWARIGVATQVDVLPSNAFFSRAAKREFAAFLIGFGSSAADSYTGMSQVVHTFDASQGLGGLNRFRFSDPAVDAALAASQTERDTGKRDALLREAARVAFVEDTALIPLHFPDNIWATRAGFTYTPRMNEGAVPQFLRRALSK